MRVLDWLVLYVQEEQGTVWISFDSIAGVERVLAQSVVSQGGGSRSECKCECELASMRMGQEYECALSIW